MPPVSGGRQCLLAGAPRPVSATAAAAAHVRKMDYVNTELMLTQLLPTSTVSVTGGGRCWCRSRTHLQAVHEEWGGLGREDGGGGQVAGGGGGCHCLTTVTRKMSNRRGGENGGDIVNNNVGDHQPKDERVGR